MKFVCKQNILSKALNTVSKAVSSKTTMAILTGILIEVDENGFLTLEATDTDISIKKTIKVDEYEPGSTVASAKLFIEIVRKLPNEDLTVKEENNMITVNTLNSEMTVYGFNAEDFPRIKEDLNENSSIIIEKELLSRMISRTSFAASSDESKGILMGVLFEMNNDSFDMVALDGFRMAVSKEKSFNEEQKKIVISSRLMNEINKIINENDSDEDIRLTISNKKVMIEIGDVSVTMRLLEGDYINYNNIIPSDNMINAIIEKSKLIESIERASLFAKGKNSLIIMNFTNNLLTITSRSEEGNVKEEIIIEKTGEDIEIGFNSKYMIDSLKVIDDEYIKISLKSNVTPALIKPVEGEDYLYLVLPVRISSI